METVVALIKDHPVLKEKTEKYREMITELRNELEGIEKVIDERKQTYWKEITEYLQDKNLFPPDFNSESWNIGLRNDDQVLIVEPHSDNDEGLAIFEAMKKMFAKKGSKE